MEQKNKIFSKEIDNEKLKSVVLYLLAFFVPIFLLIVIFFNLKVYPFGPNTYLPVDATSQYVSYLQYFRNLFFGDSGLLYSLSKSIGGEMYGLFAYYLISPYNFVTLLFHRGNATLAYDIILILKMATCSGTMVYYLNRKKKANFSNLIFGFLYAFSSYVITYGFNIMWLDGVILLPLILAGMQDIIDYKKNNLYLISLSICLITNYYIGFMICIFTAVFFIYQLVIAKDKSKKEIIKIICIFIYTSICAALISGIILIPIFVGLKNGRADFSFTHLNLDKNFEIKNLVSKLYTNSFDIEEIKNESMPPLFCGVFVFIINIIYFVNSKVKIKETIATLIIYLLFMISYYFNGANLLWMMGNTPAWYEYRYAFAFCFFSIYIAKREFENIKDVTKYRHIILAVCIYISLAIIVLLQNYRLINPNYIKMDMLLAVIFGFALLLMKVKIREGNSNFINVIKKYQYKIIIFTIICISTINIIYNANYCMDIIRKQASGISQNTYASQINVFGRIINKIKEYDTSLYRIEKQMQVGINDSLTFGYNGTSYSGSTYSKNLHEFLGKLGAKKWHVHILYDGQQTKTYDMLLGIKYIVVPPNRKSIKDYNIEFEELFIENNAKILRNPYALSLGYGVNNSILNVNTSNENAFEFQNEILKSATGIKENVYQKHNGIMKKDILNLTKDTYVYKVDGEDARIIYEFEIENTNNLYLFLSCISDNAGEIRVNNETIEKYSYINKKMINLGKRNLGEKIKVEIIPKGDIKLDELYVYYENEEALEKHYKELEKSQLNLKKINNAKYEGHINMQDDKQYLILTIPYEEGWKINIDNEETKYEKVLDSLIAIELENGEHDITFEYTPPKLYVGILASFLGLVLVFAYNLKNTLNRKGKTS